ncbi:putative ankyrin repeat protein RF_0381 isoform X1 [Chrysoperla carnea]|uniref:putative ankyrin repeat protein RF_0381 isoform X1 n=1 Tax=Chrysoperla carnea TaxID=189513 RepID=UPI001D08D782|nr:putative ankyrin repeat protein RF_0381 isoform X1 [Chrysoperla carnea]XP_044728091.1 putative ankyrin repeat protein RF_0381 isoform X1 [Chrysoperla carnea]
MNNRDIRRRLIRAIRHGKLEIARELINSYGLPYSESSSKGYGLLCYALDNKHSEIAKLILTSGSEVNSKTYNYKNSSNTPLHFAVINVDIEIIKMLLVRGANINAQNILGQTPLYNMIENDDQVEIFELLLKHEADVNVKDDCGQTPLFGAIQNNRLEIIELLLKHKADINAEDIIEKIPLFYAIENQNLKITKLLLDNGANVKDDPELLHSAAMGESPEIVELLLQHNADVNVKNRYGQTPLYKAIEYDRLEIIELLLKHKADINAEDEDRITPLFYAIQNKKLKITKLLLDNGANVKDYPELLNRAAMGESPEIVELLLQHKADVNGKNRCGQTPLFDAIQNNRIEITELLLKHNTDVNATDKYGKTALFLPVIRDSYSYLTFFGGNSYVNKMRKITKLLLDHGANVDAQTPDGETPLQFSMRNEYSHVVEVLLEYNANVNFREKINLETPLHIYARRKNVEICKILLNKGVDVDAVDCDGFTALHIASQLGHNEVVTTLLEYGSDINIMTYNNLTPLDYAETVETIEILKRHIVQMKTANLYVNQQNLLSVDGISYPNFQEKCENEITYMKSEKMNNYNISFYDILTKNTDSLAICLRNENIVQILKLDDYKTKFPIYGSMIKNCFRNGMKRKELLDQGNKILRFLFANHLQLPQECTEKIFSYLSDEDLKIIIEKSKDK